MWGSIARDGDGWSDNYKPSGREGRGTIQFSTSEEGVALQNWQQCLVFGFSMGTVFVAVKFTIFGQQPFSANGSDVPSVVKRSLFAGGVE